MHVDTAAFEAIESYWYSMAALKSVRTSDEDIGGFYDVAFDPSRKRQDFTNSTTPVDVGADVDDEVDRRRDRRNDEGR
jgi:hypothetical protein